MASFYETGREVREGTNSYLQENYGKVAEHMRRRYGMTEDDHSQEDIIKSFENSMRGFNSGNSVRVASELAYLSRAEDEDVMAAQSAYDTWDAAGSVFTSDASASEKIGAVGDYARSFIADPVNIVSLGFGRIASKFGAAGARKIAMEAAESAATQAAKRAAANGANKAAQDSAKRVAFAATQRQILRSQSMEALEDEAKKDAVRASLRRANRGDIAATTASEMAAAGSVDALYQQAQIKAGRAEDYSWEMGAFSTLAGGVGGALAVGMAALRGTSSTQITSIELNRRSDIAQRAQELSFEKASKELNVTEAVQKLKDQSGKLREQLKEMITDVGSFSERVSKGELLKLKPLVDNPELRSPFIMQMIMNGDKELGVKGINQIFDDLGIPQWSKRNPQDTRTNFVGEVLEKLPKKVQKDIEKFVNVTLKEVDPSFKGFSIKELTNFNAEVASNAGKTLRSFRGVTQTAQATGKPVDEVTFGDIMKSEVDPMKLEPEEVVGKAGKEATEESVGVQAEAWVEKAQRRWISLLITHPATTAVNAVGWAGASAHQSLSDVFKGALYGGRGAMRILSQGGKDDMKKMGLLWGLQKQKIQNMADPYDTLDNFMDLVTVRPELQKNMFSYLSGGVEINKALVGMGIDPDEAATLSGPQKLQKFFQTMYGVRAQDFLSKSQEYMYAIDKQVRQEYGMTFNDFMNQDDILDHLVDESTESFQRFMKLETKATNQTLENIFAKSYKNEPGAIGKVAGIIEDARNIPIIGTMVPFGQFFNNTVAYMLKSTPLNPMYHIWLKATNKAGRKVEGDIMESMAKMSSAVGVAGLLAVREMDNLEEGLAWSEERKTGGTVVDRALDFPYSYWKMLGRGFAHLKKDGEIPPELADEFMRTFGPESITRSIGDTGETLVEVMKQAISGNANFKNTLGDAVTQASANYISGATRVLDPFNQILASQRGEDYVAIDREQGNKFFNKSLRYVDQFVEEMKGEPMAPERNQSLQGDKPRANLSKLFGIREVLPTTNIQKMFNEVGRADWLDGIRLPDQAAENTFRKYFFPFVEMEASRLYDKRAWSQLELDQKTEVINKVMSNAKKRVRDFLRNQTNPLDRKTGLIADFDSKNLTRAETRDVLEMFEVSPDDLHTLSIPQLELLLAYAEGDTGRDQALQRRVGVE